MLVITALIHLVAFSVIAADLQSFGTRMLLAFVAVPVLALHVAVWASARALALHWAVVAAFVLNGAWAAAGLGYWALRATSTTVPWDRALSITLIFFLTGIAASGILIGWMRFVVHRRRATAR